MLIWIMDRLVMINITIFVINLKVHNVVTNFSDHDELMMNNKKFPLQIAQWNEVAEEATERKILKRYKETLDQEVSGQWTCTIVLI